MDAITERIGKPDRWTRWQVLAIGLLWVMLGAADWWLRFSWYGWQINLIQRPSAAFGSPMPPLQNLEVRASRGGDLTHLAGISSFARKFEEPRPATVFRSDEFGFANLPPVTKKYFPVVTVGDSYMASGMTMTNTFGADLSAVSQLDVYNYAHAGHGPAFSVQRFFSEERFRHPRPKVLIWGLVEREIGGDLLESLVARMWGQTASAVKETGMGVNWRALLPSSLKTSLPGSSAIAQVSAKLWTYTAFYVFGKLPVDVAVSTQPVEGQPMLFYRWAVKAMKWTPAERKIDDVVDAISRVNQYCQDNGIVLIVLLIPDKEQVYVDLLPSYLNNKSDPVPPSCLFAIEQGLRKANVRVVNLLPEYREQAKKDVLLYWRDDTHWNPRGIDLAARIVWQENRSLFDSIRSR